MDRVTSMMLVAPPPSGLGDATDSDSLTNVSGGDLSPDQVGTGNSSSTFDLWKDGEALQSIYLGYLWLSLFIGLPGNILIAVVYVVVRHKRTCDWFIFYLSVYDCAVCLFAVPLYLSIETGVWESTGSDLACKMEQFIIFTSQFSSVLILGIIAVDRYLKICHPTKRSLNAHQARNIGVGTLVLAGVIAAPLLVWEGNVDRKFCRIQARYRHTLGVKIHLCSTLGFFIVIFVLVIFCYSQVCLAVRRRIQRHRENALKRKHLLQIPAFIQAISNVDETEGGSDPKLTKGKRKFSLFNIGSSRRLSVIAPWVKARLSLPNDTSSAGGVSSRSASRAGSRASGASSTSSVSFSHRRKKKKSISTSAMVLSEKGESGADEENKDALCAERENQNASDDERRTESKTVSGKVSNGCGIQGVPEKVVVTDTGTDTEREENFSYCERSRPVPPLYKQNQVSDLELGGHEFQCVSDRGRTLGEAFLFADAPVRRSLEEEWELEMARVARERRISTDSALKRPDDPVKVKGTSATQTLFTWINKWRRKTLSSQNSFKGRQQSVDTKTSNMEETEKLFNTDTETSFTTAPASQNRLEKSTFLQRGIESGEPRSRLAHTPFRIEISPSTPMSSLRQIGRQKTSIEETAVSTEPASPGIPDQRLLHANHLPQVQAGSDSASSCLSLFDHVVCVHQAQSPMRKASRDQDHSKESPSTQPCKTNSSNTSVNFNHTKHNTINGYSHSNALNKSDTLIADSESQRFASIFKFQKSKSLSPSKISHQLYEVTQKTNSDFLEDRIVDSSKLLYPRDTCQQTSKLDGEDPRTSVSSQSLPEKLKNIFGHQDSSNDLLLEEFKPSCHREMARPLSFPLFNPFSKTKKFCSEREQDRDRRRHKKKANRIKRDNRNHIRYRLVRLSRENSFEEDDNLITTAGGCLQREYESVERKQSSTSVSDSNSLGNFLGPGCKAVPRRFLSSPDNAKTLVRGYNDTPSILESHSWQTSRSADSTVYRGFVEETKQSLSNNCNNHCMDIKCSNVNYLLRKSDDCIQRDEKFSHTFGILRSLSDKSHSDKGRGHTLSALPSNQVSLSAQHISVSSDLQNSDLYRRRMSPKREKNQRYSSKSAEVLTEPNSVSENVHLDAGVDGTISVNSKENHVITGGFVSDPAVDHPTGNGLTVRARESNHPPTPASKGDDSFDSTKSDSPSSCYASAHASKSYNDSVSDSYMSCNGSLCSNSVFTYPTYKTYTQPAENCHFNHSMDRESDAKGENGIIEDKEKESLDTSSYQTLRTLEIKDTATNCMKPTLSSQPVSKPQSDNAEDKTLDSRHLFNNTSGCHSLYSPPESPQNNSIQQAHLSSQPASQSIQPNHLPIAAEAASCKAKHGGEHDTSFDFLPYLESLSSYHDTFHVCKDFKQCFLSPNQPSSSQCDYFDFNTYHLVSAHCELQESSPLNVGHVISSRRCIIPNVYLGTESSGPFLCSLCLISQLQNQNTHAGIEQRTRIYDVNFSIPCVSPSCLFSYLTSLSNPKCSSHILSNGIFLLDNIYNGHIMDCTICALQPFSFSPTPCRGVINTEENIPHLDTPVNESTAGLTSPVIDKNSCQNNDNFPDLSLTQLEPVIITSHVTDCVNFVNPSCKLNGQGRFVIDILPFHDVEKPYPCTASKYAKTCSNLNFDHVNKHSLNSTAHVFCSRHGKRGILSWLLYKPALGTSVFSSEIANSFCPRANSIFPATCQCAHFYSHHLQQTKITGNVISSKPEVLTSRSEANTFSDYSDRLTKTQSVNSSLAHLFPSSGSDDAASTPPPKMDRDAISKYINSKVYPQIDSPQQKKKRTWSLSKAEGLFKFRKPSTHPRSPKAEPGCFPLAGSPHVKRTSLRKKAVIAAGIRDSILVETILSHISTPESANAGESAVDRAAVQAPSQPGDQSQVDPSCHGNGIPRVPPSSFSEDVFPHLTTKTVHSALLKCVPTVQSPSDHSARYNQSVSASESIVNTPTSTGSATPSSTCEIFVRSVFDAFVTGNGFISSSEPCLPIFSSPGNVAENGRNDDMIPLDVPLTPLLARNDNRRRSASNRGGAEGNESPYPYGDASASMSGDGTAESCSPPAMSAADCKLYQLVRQNREALFGSTHAFTLGTPACMSPGASSTITATNVTGTSDRDTTDHHPPRSRKQSTLSHSWFSLDDLESTRKPSRFRLRSFYYLNSLRHQIERAFSLGHIRSFLGLGEAEVRKRRNASRKMPRDTLAANQINVIITRCESIVLDRSAEEINAQTFRDRSSSLDPCTGDMPSNGGASGGAGGGTGVEISCGVSDSLDQWDINLPKHHNYQHRHSADAASTTSSTNRANFDRMGKPRAASLDTARGSSFSQSDDMSSRGASLDLLSPASASIRTGSVCSGMSTLSRLTECSAYTENSRSDCERITRRSAEREHNITKLLGVITFIFVISWSVSWGVIIGDTLGLTPGSSHATVTYSGTTQERHSPASAASSASSSVDSSSNSGMNSGTSAAGSDLHSTATPAAHLTVSLARNLFLVNHFCNIVVYAWLSKSFREKLAECYKTVLP